MPHNSYKYNSRGKKKRGRTKIKPQLDPKTPSYCQKCQHDVAKANERPRIEPQKIFEMGSKK